jgi:LacI family transcriptional regulator
MAVTLNDVAERAGVSVSTVSRVLSKQAAKYRISADTESKIFQAAHDLKYRVNHVARGLRLQKTNTIGVVAPDISNPFFAQIVGRIQTVARGLGYSIIVCNTDENLDLEVEQVSLLQRKRVDGLIAMPVGQRYDHFADWMEKDQGLVLVDRCFDGIDAAGVCVDNFRGAYEAVEHLLDHGHRRIGIIQGLPGTFTTSARLDGYKGALAAHEVPFDPTLVVGGDFRRENGYVATKLLLNLDRPPTALFATSDLITLGVLDALAEEGVDLPRDLSLVSFDDFDFAPYLKTPLTVVWQPKEMMGELAVKLLVEQLENGRNESRRIILKPRLLRRESVAAPRAGALASDGPAAAEVPGG